MSRYYLDASALVKRYVNEEGSDWLRATITPARSQLLFTSRMTIVEVISAFARRVRDGSLTLEEFASARDLFRGDCFDEYQIMPPTIVVIDSASVLLELHPLRAYDAIHLATALGAQQFLADQDYPALTFLSADDRLNEAATAEGLAVGNPNAHP
ncbi:MAG: type II toxin-antitoxin system VapC family toxin [Anaerolineae bacterium]|nr:type II toxin-antitoxin system VapC family toxin [Anaerolineae bacterium]